MRRLNDELANVQRALLTTPNRQQRKALRRNTEALRRQCQALGATGGGNGSCARGCSAPEESDNLQELLNTVISNTDKAIGEVTPEVVDVVLVRARKTFDIVCRQHEQAYSLKPVSANKEATPMRRNVTALCQEQNTPRNLL